MVISASPHQPAGHHRTPFRCLSHQLRKKRVYGIGLSSTSMDHGLCGPLERVLTVAWSGVLLYEPRMTMQLGRVCPPTPAGLDSDHWTSLDCAAWGSILLALLQPSVCHSSSQISVPACRGRKSPGQALQPMPVSVSPRRPTPTSDPSNISCTQAARHARSTASNIDGLATLSAKTFHGAVATPSRKAQPGPVGPQSHLLPFASVQRFLVAAKFRRRPDGSTTGL